jgi:hypothetical protein
MPRGNSYAANLKEWEDTLASVAANAAELPQLEVQRAKLEKALGELRELLQTQAVHRSSKQQASKRMQTLLATGKKTATSIQAVLKEHYGNTNEKLVEFGVPPLRARRRKAVAGTNPQPPEKPKPQAAEPPSPSAE